MAFVFEKIDNPHSKTLKENERLQKRIVELEKQVNSKKPQNSGKKNS